MSVIDCIRANANKIVRIMPGASPCLERSTNGVFPHVRKVLAIGLYTDAARFTPLRIDADSVKHITGPTRFLNLPRRSTAKPCDS